MNPIVTLVLLFRVYRLDEENYEINNFPVELGVRNLLLSYHNVSCFFYSLLQTNLKGRTLLLRPPEESHWPISRPHRMPRRNEFECDTHRGYHGEK
jgi:hypothetical protein